MVSLQAIQYGGRLVILADGQLTAAAVTNALFGAGFVYDVVAGAALCADAAAGHTAEEIQRACTDLAPRVEASFVIDRLDYLYKGGRCSALSAFGGNLLKLKPCIEVKDGKMTPGKKYRGPIDKVMLQYAQDRLQGRDDINRHRVFITHTRCAPEAVEAVRQKLLELCPDFEEIIETTAGSTVTSHCGPGTLGVLFIRSK